MTSEGFSAAISACSKRRRATARALSKSVPVSGSSIPSRQTAGSRVGRDSVGSVSTFQILGTTYPPLIQWGVSCFLRFDRRHSDSFLGTWLKHSHWGLSKAFQGHSRGHSVTYPGHLNSFLGIWSWALAGHSHGHSVGIHKQFWGIRELGISKAFAWAIGKFSLTFGVIFRHFGAGHSQGIRMGIRWAFVGIWAHFSGIRVFGRFG